MYKLTRRPPRRERVFAVALCVGLLAATSGWSRDVVPMSEVKGLQSELQKNAEECRGEIMPYVAGIDAEVQRIEALSAKLSSDTTVVVPIGGQSTTVGGISVQTMTLNEFVMFLQALEDVGLINKQGRQAFAARALELTASLQLNLSAKARELTQQKASLTTYCQETETMLAQATELVNALQQSENTTTGRRSRSSEIIINSASVEEAGLTCEVGATTASCVKITGGDRCSYRAWWEFPSIGELVPGKTFELEVRGAYACNYDAGPAPKRGPNWGTGIGYDYRGGLLGLGWHMPGGNGLPGWVGATGCTMYFGAHGSGSTEPDVKKTCGFFVPETFPNRRLHKADPNEPDYRIQAVFGPTGWAAQWVIR